MASGGATVTYNLYQDAARSVPWGSRNNSALGTVPAMAGTGGSATNFTVTLYGRIYANQSTVAPGSYASSFFGSADTNLFMLTSPSTDCMTGPIDGTVPTVQPSFTVSATPGANCNLTTNPLAFGAQGLLNADVDATTTLQVQCTSTSPYNVGLDAGQASGATVSTRRMTFGAATVSYALYRDAGRTLNWGQTIGTDTLAGTGTGVSQTITVYGRVPVQTTPAPGTYTDTVAVTVTY
jgi:spore coat protein U-like protein